MNLLHKPQFKITICWFLTLLFLTHCLTYQRIAIPLTVPETISGRLNDRKVILHAGEDLYLLQQPVLMNDSLLQGNAEILNVNQDKQREEKKVMHLYLNAGILSPGPVSVPLSSIETIEITQGNTAVNSVVIIGSILLAGAIVLLIVAAATSCPYIYVYDGHSFVLSGEVYGGANLACLERNDYLPLPGFHPEDGYYKVKIANELPEIQYINQSELWIVHHPENTTVLADKQGHLLTLASPQVPVSVVSAGLEDQSALVNENDQNYFLFNEDPALTGDTMARNSLVLTFDAPVGTDTGKLVLRAKNSYWGDYVCGEFTRMFGNKYGHWIRKQGKAPAEQIISNRQEQNLFLMTYLETTDGWQLVDYFNMAGPLGFRDMVMPIDLSNALRSRYNEGEQVRVKLETGFMFWELDYAAMDFTEDLPVSLEKLTASYAVNESGKEVGKFLAQDDRHYYEQPSAGNEVVLDFASPPDQPGTNTSVLLHTKGYYEHARNYQGPPDKQKLEAFRQPGRLSKYSYELLIKTKDEYTAKHASTNSK